MEAIRPGILRRPAFNRPQRRPTRASPRARRRRLCLFAVSATPWKKKDARLVLEDGTVWPGVGFGAKGTHIAEVVFNTSMTGYQEIMTDPSYKGQFVCFTHPHIGNVGVNADDVESRACHLRGIIVRDLSRIVSNYRAKTSLSEYCEENDVLGIAELDTRALTKRIREKGALVGVITSDVTVDDGTLHEQAQSWKIEGRDLLKEVTTAEGYEWRDVTDAEWDHTTDRPSHAPLHVVAYDFGIKRNILRRLASHGCHITVVSAETPAAKVLAMQPDGVFFSNGPGDPSAAPYAVENAKEILGKVPVFGICMGHQLLGQAFGGRTFKLKFGHHGGNHPIRHMPTGHGHASDDGLDGRDGAGRIEISAQNHNFAVDPATLPEDVEVTHVNLNDGTCAGMKYPRLKAITIQYHPEASPGPHDSDRAFAEFVEMMAANA